MILSAVPYSCGDINYDDEDWRTCEDDWARKIAIANIFVSVIPATLVSVGLWVKKSVPPCGFTTFLGISVFGIALNVAVNASSISGSFLKWWSLVTSVVWVLVLSYLSIVTDNKVSQPPLTWGLITGSSVFYCTMFAAVELWRGEFVRWIIINVLSFIPLVYLGIVTDHNFVVFLGAFGFLIDAWRVSVEIGIVIVQFIWFAFGGLLVVGMGVWLKSKQTSLRDPIVRFLKGHDSTPEFNNVENEGENNETVQSMSNYQALP